ncbi:hypothetical protein IKJ53_02525, partial [bacterium]|nr:hypothetical protein [bacterium]
YDYYSRYRRGEIELSKDKVATCESYLTDEEMDEINYSEEVRENDAASKIDTSGTEKNTKGNKWANGVGATLLGGGGSVAGILFAKGAVENAEDGEKATISVWSAIWTSAIVAVGAIASILLANNFDNAFKERTAARDSAGDTNTTMDGYADALGGTMEMMAEDEKLYQEQREQVTLARNEQTSRAAELQMQIDTADAMGDTAGAEKAKAELQQLQQTDNSAMEEDLAETQGAIAEYGAMAAEAEGVKGSGQSVTNFLKEGKGMGVMAAINGGLLAIAAIICGLAAIKSVGAAKMPFELPVGIAAAVVYGVAAAGMGVAGGIMLKKAGDEFKCSQAGEEMDPHIKDLNDMINAQKERTEVTSQVFTDADEAGKGAEEDATKNADNAKKQNEEILNPSEEEGNIPA